MPYLGIMEAVRARLEGNSPFFVPQLPDLPKEWDHQQPSREEGVNLQAFVEAYMKQSRFADIGKIRVPIFIFDYQGQQTDTIYPSFTYEILDVLPRYNEFIYQSDSYRGDEYQIPITTTTQPVFDSDNNFLGNYPRAIKRRPVEHPVDVLFEVRCYADDPIISALLVEYIFKIFPPRYFMRVPMKDGTFRSWDVLFENYRDLDKRDAVRAGTPGTQREYCKVFTYKVEGYFDNTDETDLVNLIRKSITTLDIDRNASIVPQTLNPSVWKPQTAYTAKQIVVPFSSGGSLQFECVVAGTSSLTEPTWPTVTSNTIIDGTVTWQAIG